MASHHCLGTTPWDSGIYHSWKAKERKIKGRALGMQCQRNRWRKDRQKGWEGRKGIRKQVSWQSVGERVSMSSGRSDSWRELNINLELIREWCEDNGNLLGQYSGTPRAMQGQLSKSSYNCKRKNVIKMKNESTTISINLAKKKNGCIYLTYL